MTDLITSPLFLALVLFWLLQVWELRRRWKEGFTGRIMPLCMLLLLSLFTAASTPVFARWLESKLILNSSEYTGPRPQAVVVLAAGYTPGPEPDEDRLGWETFIRVTRGAKVYKSSGAEWLIMSGIGSEGHPERQCELMRDVAVSLGVQKDHIILETKSRNTWDHPCYLMLMKKFNRESRLIVSSSPHHLFRAMREFKKYFPNAVPIKNYDIPHPAGAAYYLPQINGLEYTAKILHEYLGVAWYEFKRMTP